MSSNNRPVRLASIGVGNWGTMLAQAVKHSGVAEIGTCFAPTQAHCRVFAERFGCRVSPSYDAILSDPTVEGILLATPNGLHRDQIEQAARHGKHVYVEKPIALSVADAQAATRCCAEHGVTLAVGHQSRRETAIRQLKSLIESGELGQVVGAEANISTGKGLEQSPHDWRWNRAECPGGPLIQIGIHHIDTLCFLLGPVTRVYGVQRRLVASTEAEDATMTLLEFASGVIGHLSSHYVTARAVDLRIMGTKANACYDRLLGIEIRRDTRERVVRETLPLRANDPLCEEITEFAQCVRTGIRPEVGGEEATHALAVVLAAVEANQCGSAVGVRDVIAGTPQPETI